MRVIYTLLLASVIVCAEDWTAVEKDIQAALVNRIDTANNSVGIVVGILTPDGRSYISHGLTKKDGGVKPGPDTIFEIASITKVFTSLLLADMAERGEVKLDDPISVYLPRAVTAPTRNGKAITLADLATHTSGLPRDASNLDLTQENPFAAYGPEQLYAFLSRYALTRNPGERYEYSNVGALLLGHILTLRAGMTYEELLKTRVLEPLKMTSTTITLSRQQRDSMPLGHDSTLKPMPLWDVDAIVGAGSIRSTAADMLTFAAAYLGLIDNPLAGAMRRMVSISRPSGSPSMTLHLGWVEYQAGGGILGSNGRRGSFTSALAIRPTLKRAVIVLSNSIQEVTDIAIHGVQPERPLTKFDPPPTGIRVDEAMLESYTGVYEFGPLVSIRITREGSRMFGLIVGQGRFEMFSSSETEFDVKIANARISFVKDDAGTVTALALRQNGVDQRARKVQ